MKPQRHRTQTRALSHESGILTNGCFQVVKKWNVSLLFHWILKLKVFDIMILVDKK